MHLVYPKFNDEVTPISTYSHVLSNLKNNKADGIIVITILMGLEIVLNNHATGSHASRGDIVKISEDHLSGQSPAFLSIENEVISKDFKRYAKLIWQDIEANIEISLQAKKGVYQRFSSEISQDQKAYYDSIESNLAILFFIMLLTDHVNDLIKDSQDATTN